MTPDHLNLPDLELTLFPDGSAPDDDDSLAMAHIVLEILARRFGGDTILGMLIELGDLEAACSHPDSDDE